ncbi:MAG: bifunctional phosphopantothenoylcysteine decarboxylase/phosphopantothenate--cysteine ligase CoaBC, partial [Bacteroidales bacterium]
MLKGKHILLGITGSIAAYKAAILVRLLVKEGAEVKIVMTKMAKEFISPLTMATLSRNPILVDFYNPENGDWNSHVSLGLWADLYLIAPASANTLAKMATGVADNLLLTSYLSSRCPVAIAPAMDLDMFLHPATQYNLELLNKRGVLIIEPSSGELASGLEGKGRMEEPEVILAKINTFFSKKKSKPFFNKKVIVTAGPTVEQIDPVRFISNHSTGKMGYAIAQEFAEQGAEVVVVSGPVQIPVPKGVKVINVQSAQQMFQQTMQQYQSGADIVVLSAAVSDYTSANQSQSKLKRDGETLHLQLIPTQDIAASLGKIKK